MFCGITASNTIEYFGSPLSSTIPPRVSGDGSHVAFLELDREQNPTELKVTVANRSNWASTVTASLQLPPWPRGSLCLLTAEMDATGNSVAAVLSVSVPVGDGIAVSKGGNAIAITSQKWQSSHYITVLDISPGDFTALVDLQDRGSLARVNVAVNQTSVLVYTVAEVTGSSLTTKAPTTDVTPQLRVVDRSSGNIAAPFALPGSWPVNGERPCFLSDGRVARLCWGSALEVVNPRNRGANLFNLPAIASYIGKGACRAQMQVRGGAVYVASVSSGYFARLEPANSFEASQELRFEPALLGAREFAPYALDSDATTLYISGPNGIGGVVAYNLATGQKSGTFTDGATVSGLLVLPSGNVLLSFDGSNQRFVLVSPSLELLADAPLPEKMDVQTII